MNSWYRKVEKRVLLFEPFEVVFSKILGVNFLLLSWLAAFRWDDESGRIHGGIISSAVGVVLVSIQTM